VSAAGYPSELERVITVRDGAVVRLRPIRADDAPRLQALHARLSLQTIYQRFFNVMRRLPTDWARYLADVDYRSRLALVVEWTCPDGTAELVGVGRYEPTSDAARAEVAFVIDDRWQGRGLGTVLFNDLLAAAEARGIREFSAEVLADNTRMLDLIARFTTIVSRRLADGIVSLVFTRRSAAPEGVRSRRRDALAKARRRR
jgi:GNAT superfamily N-acetyltransferase